MNAKSGVDHRVDLSEAACSASVKGIIRKLVSQAMNENSDLAHPRTPDNKNEIVLFDTQVDGVRCLLIREDNPAATHVLLSPREQEIARMIAKGQPNKTIALVLEISLWTVGTHLRRMFAKAGVNSRAALVAKLSETRYLHKQ